MSPLIHLMRLHKPIGIWLTFWPAAWAVAMASPAPIHTQWVLLALLLLGAALMRSAGCIINDLADRKFDAQVARTAGRPLAAGTVSRREALLLLALLLLLAFGLLLVLPYDALWLALLTLPLVALYPFMKRFTWWPQLFLGLTFNLSALFGWLEASGDITLSAAWLYIAAIFWTLGYDTLYAMQDMADDARIGVKSTALRLGSLAVPFVAMCYTHMLGVLLWLGVLHHMPLGYYIGLACAAAQLCWQLRHIHQHGAAVAGRVFCSNQWLGLVVFLAIISGAYLPL